MPEAAPSTLQYNWYAIPTLPVPARQVFPRVGNVVEASADGGVIRDDNLNHDGQPILCLYRYGAIDGCHHFDVKVGARVPYRINSADVRFSYKGENVDGLRAELVRLLPATDNRFSNKPRSIAVKPERQSGLQDGVIIELDF